MNEKKGAPPYPGGYSQAEYSGYPPQNPGFAPQGSYAAPPAAGFIDSVAPPYGPTNQDVESQQGEVKGFDFTEKSIRNGFIRKVYSILMCQLMITVAMICLFLYHEGTKRYVHKHSELVLIAFIVTIVLILCMACCSSVRRKAPTNFIFLFLFTLAEGFLLATAASTYDKDEVLMAAGITAVICLGLTLFAFQTKWDFTGLGTVLFVAILILFLFGIITAILGRDRILSIVYSSIAAFIFSMYLIYDTQLMLGGKHKYSISPEEYIFAALNLYLDIIQIFLHILAIIGSSRN